MPRLREFDDPRVSTLRSGRGQARRDAAGVADDEFNEEDDFVTDFRDSVGRARHPARTLHDHYNGRWTGDLDAFYSGWED